MKSQKGVTLTALVIYVGVFMLILTIMSTISAYFYRNVGQIKDSPKYISEFNKFSMFFVADVKNNTAIRQATSTALEFDDGTIYEYKNNAIYRNGEVIAKYISKFNFNVYDQTVSQTTKKIINVEAELGNSVETITRDIDFVLRYW